MLAQLIRRSVDNRYALLLAGVALLLLGLWALRHTPVDALPDLSDVQVIVRVSYPGQPPQIVQDQVTYPLTTVMLSVPGARTVRGYSMFGDAYIYILFAEGTDLYWARSRVLEYMNQAQSQLPAGVTMAIGPDATGVGWIYEYALVDRSGQHDLAELRSLQDWFLRFELKTLPNVAEVASVGGMVKQYQVQLDPQAARAYAITPDQVVAALRRANNEVGGAVIEMSGSNFMVRSHGYLHQLSDFEQVPLRTLPEGRVIRIADVAHVQLGPQLRVGISELDGQGEAPGGIILLRSGKNAMSTLQAIKARLHELQASLPAGVEIVPVYDRSELIRRAIETLQHKLVEEFLIVALVTFIFLGHLRSSLVAISILPLGVLSAFIIMHLQGINANIMSLGGIAIAIGAMIDAAVVMIENAHKHLDRAQAAKPQQPLRGEERWQVILASAVEVGPALFFSLLIITVSFIPVLTLSGQEGRLFAPLAYTKTYVMAAAALLSLSLVPVLMGFWIRGRIPAESAHPINRWLIQAYTPWVRRVLAAPWTTLLLGVLLSVSLVWPMRHLGGEFLPPLDEGSLLYMPSALPGLSNAGAAHLLQLADRMIKTVPEVEHVFGKAGRADTSTDPSPLEMFENVITFKPKAQWRPGMTPAKLRDALDQAVHIPGLSNIWVQPIRNRIDMLSTGIKSPIGIKVYGEDLAELDRLSQSIAAQARTVPGVSSVFAERAQGGHYIDVDIDRDAAARYGMNLADVQSYIRQAVGGEDVGQTVEGLARYPIQVRYPRAWRDSPEALAALPVVTPSGQSVTLGMLAKIRMGPGPAMLRSENARLSNWIYIDIDGRDLVSVVHDLRRVVAARIRLPAGYSLQYAGQFAALQHAEARLQWVIPATLALIFVLLYLNFRRIDEALLIMATLPMALTGGFWLLYLLHYDLSVAVVVGFIALAGVAAEFGVVMLIYLRSAIAKRTVEGAPLDDAALDEALHEGMVLRIRPKAMTVSVVLAGLLPIMLGQGAGSEIMRRIAAPLVGGMISAPLLSLLVLPAAYRILYRWRRAQS